MYNFLKFLHVASMAIWIGGMFTLLMLNRIIQAAGDSATLQGLGRTGAKMGPMVFMPAMLLTVITGIGMVQVGELSFGATWVVWGIVGVVASIVLGGILVGGTARKLGMQMAKGEITPEQAAPIQRRIMMYAVVNLLVLLSIVWAMVAKPA